MVVMQTQSSWYLHPKIFEFCHEKIQYIFDVILFVVLCLNRQVDWGQNPERKVTLNVRVQADNRSPFKEN